MQSNLISSRDLLHDPIWREEELGKTLPDHPHATSVALPLWQHVVGYEENDPGVLNAMHCGYPRFVVHPLVRQLFDQCRERFAGAGENAFAFPSAASAARCCAYIAEKTGAAARVEPVGRNDVFAVIFSQDSFDAAKKYWQHFGEILSSRQAQATLEGRGPETGEAAKHLLRERVAGFAGCAAGDVFLYPSGMAALAQALRLVQEARPGCKSVQLGFPYVDLLKIQSVTGPGVHFFPHPTSESIAQIAALLKQEELSAVFCELPGNPMLQSPDLAELSALLRKHQVPLIVDDTVATFVNVDLAPYADIIVSSLTKAFSGVGDVMAGSIVLSPQSPHHARLAEIQGRMFEDLFWPEDAQALEENSRDFEARVKRMNATTEAVCDYLARHPRVERVYYPKFDSTHDYEKVMRPGGGYGCLFSFLLKDPGTASAPFYDRLRVCKGPSLGMNFTLVCPYILLAHYQELDWTESVGISRYLIRVSVGLECAEDLIARFQEALQ